MLFGKGCLKVLYPNDRLGSLRALSKFNFNGFGPIFLYGNPRDSHEVVISIALHYYLSISTVILVEAVESLFQQGEMCHLPVADHQIRVFVSCIFTNYTAHPCHCGSAKVILPVKLDQGRQDYGHRHLDRVIKAVGPFQPNRKNSGFFCVLIGSLGTKYTTVDSEMREINGIVFFRCNLIIASCRGIYRLRTQDSCLGQLTRTIAILCAKRTHSRLGRYKCTTISCKGKARTQSWGIRHISSPSLLSGP